MKVNRLLPAAAAAAAFFALPAAAQQTAKEYYAGVQLGRAVFSDVCDNTAASCDDSAAAYGAFFGMQFSRYLAAEFGLQDTSRGASVGGVDFKASIVNLDAVATFPLFGGLSALVRGGLFYGMLKSDGREERTTGLDLGLGGQYDFSRSAAVRLEWQRHPGLGGGQFGAKTDLDRVTLGALFRF